MIHTGTHVRRVVTRQITRSALVWLTLLLLCGRFPAFDFFALLALRSALRLYTTGGASGVLLHAVLLLLSGVLLYIYFTYIYYIYQYTKIKINRVSARGKGKKNGNVKGPQVHGFVVFGCLVVWLTRCVV